jgi:hypothetical protein
MKTCKNINTICSQVQREILASGDFLSPAIESHCRDCEACRRVKDDWRLLRDAKNIPDIPLSNDFVVITAARKLSKSRRIQVAVRRFLGYTAATASGIAAIYTVVFNGQMPGAGNDVFSKAWNWDSFEEKVFVLDTATEISRQDIKFGSWKYENGNSDGNIDVQDNIEQI